MTRTEFIKKFSPVVIEASINTGLFPSLFLAQAILESGDGKSLLSSKYKNYFGIKADKSWKGKKVNLNTREVIEGNSVVIGDWFRVYNNANDSFFDRVQFLIKNPRYTKHGVFTADTPQKQADALQRAGYATDPNYAQTLKNLIKMYKLETLDEKKKAQ